MSRLPRLITAVAVTILLAACGQAGENPVGPAGPSLDGGLLTGGGNRTEADSTSITSADAPADSTGRGGLLTGGGN